MDIEKPLFVRDGHWAPLRPQHQARNRRPPLLQTLARESTCIIRLYISTRISFLLFLGLSKSALVPYLPLLNYNLYEHRLCDLPVFPPL